MDLSEKSCVPCQGGVPPLKAEALKNLVSQLSKGWKLVGEHHLEKHYPFKNFKEALDFTNRVGALAEEVNHHPDLFLTWGQVTVQIWTHKIEGLTESDFIFAAKCDTLIN